MTLDVWCVTLEWMKLTKLASAAANICRQQARIFLNTTELDCSEWEKKSFMVFKVKIKMINL